KSGSFSLAVMKEGRSSLCSNLYYVSGSSLWKGLAVFLPKQLGNTLSTLPFTPPSPSQPPTHSYTHMHAHTHTHTHKHTHTHTYTALMKSRSTAECQDEQKTWPGGSIGSQK